MTFNTNVPVSGDTLGGTRDIIRTNFQRIAAVDSVNHVPFNASGEGKHKFMQMPESGTGFDNNDTSPTTAANEGALYAKESGSKTCLFWREESNGAEIQLTGSVTASTNGTTLLPGGIILKWGTKSSPGTSGSVSFSPAFPNNVYNVQLTTRRDNSDSTQGMYLNGAPTTSGFSYNGTGSSTNALFWVAIGN